MIKGILRLLKKPRPSEKQREAIMEIVRKATAQGLCVILAETPEGTRIIVLGRDTLTRQLEQISKEKGVKLW